MYSALNCESVRITWYVRTERGQVRSGMNSSMSVQNCVHGAIPAGEKLPLSTAPISRVGGAEPVFATFVRGRAIYQVWIK
ncbi:MAG TPA: hypothetical protein VJT32_04170 [bacterium]|nr:hypothetical protein [bacterium]